MNWKIFYAKKALRELDEIYDYISDVLLAPKAARSLFELISTEIRSLSQMPMRNGLCDESPWREVGIRKMTVKNYLIFYRPDEENHTVYILKIIYGGRDISKHLTDIE